MSVEIAVDLVKTIFENVVEPVAKNAVDFAKDEWEKFKVDSDLAFHQYLENAYDKHSKIKTLLYREAPKELYKFFEPPTLRKGGENYESSDIDVILDISHFLIIEATGGQGKSTLMKYFFLNELTKKDLIPIFLELNSLNSMEDDYEISDFIFEKLYHLRSDLKKEYLEYALDSGCFLFLLDGYDEIVTAKKNVFYRKFINFCDRYSNNYYIATSRPGSEFIEFQRFTVLKLCKFSKEQALSQINKLEFDAEVKEKFCRTLDERLYDSHESFASNPLLLTIMLLTFDDYADVPAKMHLFYAQVFYTFCSRHDATKGAYKRPFDSNLSPDLFKKVFATFSFLSYYHAKCEFTYDELVDYFNKVKNYVQFDFNIGTVIADLETNLCFLLYNGSRYQFIHKSFQEYFSAVFLKGLPDEEMRQRGISLIVNNKMCVSCDSTFPMLFDMVQERMEQKILLPLLTDFDKECGSIDFRLLLKKLYVFYDIIIFGCQIIAISPKKPFSDLKENEKKFVFLVEMNYYLYMKLATVDNQSRRLLHYLREQIDYQSGNKIPLLELLEDDTFCELFKKTWAGQCITTLFTLKETLEQKKIDSRSELDAFLMLP